jgi:hypothetical protein
MWSLLCLLPESVFFLGPPPAMTDLTEIDPAGPPIGLAPRVGDGEARDEPAIVGTT